MHEVTTLRFQASISGYVMANAATGLSEKTARLNSVFA